VSKTSLQLFPLQTVLYPHCILPLHIFENRYQTMIRMCLEHDVPFGIVQIASGIEIGRETSVPFDVGTVAHIRQATLLEDGRLLINTQGGDRFRILESSYDEDCLTALVETYRDEPELTGGLDLVAGELRETFQTYWTALERALRKPLGRFELPQEPDILSWLIPSALQHVPPSFKQALLEAQSVRRRLVLEQNLLQEEIHKLQSL